MYIERNIMFHLLPWLIFCGMLLEFLIYCHSLSNEFSMLKALDILDQGAKKNVTLCINLTDPNLFRMEFHTSKPWMLLCSRIVSLFASITKFLINVWIWVLQHSPLSCALENVQREWPNASAKSNSRNFITLPT